MQTSSLWLKKIDECACNSEKSSTTKTCEHIPCISSMSAILKLENKHSLYKGEDCMKKFFAFLKGHATNVFSFEKKKILPLTKKSWNDTKMWRHVNKI